MNYEENITNNTTVTHHRSIWKIIKQFSLKIIAKIIPICFSGVNEIIDTLNQPSVVVNNSNKVSFNIELNNDPINTTQDNNISNNMDNAKELKSVAILPENTELSTELTGGDSSNVTEFSQESIA
ncbi:hypothetical protein [Rickettsia endosymbiont of Cardiosporidium cionae]|uniref:hypothetical protein n=1 Tax=Rickettsia endosymbiont of Cardiosporidium cionae TaxID=2777155 RepID=UPI0018946D59|nr:hypothetical protein [Rickettsia endosymbiont of Cardiosporidium cionae]KAF8818889.1 hypothetical protein IHI24_000123 [Rickettsia endosymbiont of Cardiosporidium cionae]